MVTLLLVHAVIYLLVLVERPASSFWINNNNKIQRKKRSSLAMMQVWLDACNVCPADPDRCLESDAIVVPGNDKSLSKICDKSIPTIKIRRTSDDRLTKEDGTMMGIVVQDQDAAIAAVGSVAWILIDMTKCHEEIETSDTSWRMIPAENIISVARGAGTNVAFTVDQTGDVMGLSRALELGVDALCVAADASNDLWNAVCAAREERGNVDSETKEVVEPSIVTGHCRRKSTNTLLADRVCVDLVRTLSSTEGCWIGSSAQTMALVLSEAAPSALVPSRPFRINAGPVHSYIVLGDGTTTKYLCELEAGDEVLVFDATTGTSRAVGVGRLKIEVRPCVVVELFLLQEGENDKPPSQIILQQAETVRLGESGEHFVRVTDLNPEETQSPVLLRIATSGTHVGKAYSGTVIER